VLVYALTTWAVYVQAQLGLKASSNSWAGKVKMVTTRPKTCVLIPCNKGRGTSILGIILFILLNWSYTTAVFSDPGSTLSSSTHNSYSAVPAEEDARNAILTSLTAKSTGELRFCKKCQSRKPDRCHHCSSCRRCVLKMDHHCPWLATCVGFRNYKAFLLFLIYVCLFCYLCFAVALEWLLRDMMSQGQFDETFAPVNNILLAVVSGIFGLVLTGFTGWHIYLASRNMTTIESMEKTRYLTPSKREDDARHYIIGNGSSHAELVDHIIQAPGVTRPEEGEVVTNHNDDPSQESNNINVSPAQKSLRRNYSDLERERERARYNAYLDERDSQSLPHAFDLGWRRNLLQIFGAQPILWFVPILNSIGDGWMWQPSQKWQDTNDALRLARAARQREDEAAAAERSRQRQSRQFKVHVAPPPKYGSGPTNGEGRTNPNVGIPRTTNATANWNDIPGDFLDNSTQPGRVGRRDGDVGG